MAYVFDGGKQPPCHTNVDGSGKHGPYELYIEVRTKGVSQKKYR